jgi:hypothetical protein
MHCANKALSTSDFNFATVFGYSGRGSPDTIVVLSSLVET